MNNIYKKFNSKSTNISLEEAFNDVLRDATVLNTLPDDIKKSPEFLSNVLYIFPSLFQEASKAYLEKDHELLKKIITEPIASLDNRPFETLSLAHEKIKTRDFCLEMIAINPYNIRHVPTKFLYDSDFIEAALISDGATVQFMPSFVKQNEKFGLIAVNNNGFSLKYFSPQIVNSREVLLTALNTKGFSLSQFENPELMCHDSEIAEKALKADPKAIQFFQKDNPLLKDKYFAIKIIPYNAKLFALFDQEIRHDPDTLLQIVKGKSVETILYIVSQEFTLYPKFFLFALDAYQKCLTDYEKQNNFGFYYYLHTSLFKERQKKFNIAYRRNLERQKALAEQEEQKELERRKQAQAHISKSSELAISSGAIIENNAIPSLLHKEVEATENIENTQIENKSNTGNIRLNDLYKIQTSKDFLNIENKSSKSIIKTTENEKKEDEDFSHLVNLAEEILNEDNNEDNTKNSSTHNTNNIAQNIVLDEGFISLNESNINNSELSDYGITTQTFVDYQYYPSDKVKKANEELNQIPVAPLNIPKMKQVVPNVSRYQEPEKQFIEDKIEPIFESEEDMSPAQNAAKRAFGNRVRNSFIPDIKEENDYVHRPVKRETTKKGTMSIFNFNKDK